MRVFLPIRQRSPRAPQRREVGDEARLPYGDKYEVKFLREGDSWTAKELK